MPIQFVKECPQEFLEKEIQETYGKTLLSYLLERKEEYQYFIYKKKEILGVLVVENETMRPILLTVKEEDQNEIGKELIESLKQEAFKNELYRITTNCPQEELSLYQSCGFEIVGDIVDGGIRKYIPMECLLGDSLLGLDVEVNVDHPLASFHPRYADEQYPINVGYVYQKNDGNDQIIEAYVIGPDEPIDTFSGTIVGIVYRKESEEIRVIVMGKGLTIQKESIINSIGFEEQYYDTYIRWIA